MVTYVWRNQARMTPAMAYDFDAMAAEFRRVHGVDLLGTSGVRLDAEQLAIWHERMVPSSQVNGRKVYEFRWWNGILWARISPAGTVAPPGSSNHQLSAGRKGAADLRDSGTDPGVTRFGTVRDKWLRANAPRWGYNGDEGKAVGEPWHYRYTRDPYRSVPGAAGGGSTPTRKSEMPTHKEFQHGPMGLRTKAEAEKDGRNRPGGWWRAWGGPKAQWINYAAGTGGLGSYMWLLHFYGKGLPVGETVDVRLVFVDSKGNESPHYVGQLVGTKDGAIAQHVSFARPITKATTVYLDTMASVSGVELTMFGATVYNWQ